MIPVYLHKGLELGPVAILRLVKSLPASQYDVKTDPGRFSLREAVAHISDWAQVDMDRLKAGLAEPGCTVPGIDEGQRAIDENYAAKDPVAEAECLIERRREMMAIVDSLSDDQLGIVFYHSERGRLTVMEHLVTMLGHETYHLEHLTQYLDK